MKLVGTTALITGGGIGIGSPKRSTWVISPPSAPALPVSGVGRQAIPNWRAGRPWRDDIDPDVVFANAGISASTPLGATDPAALETVIRTTLTGAFFILEAALPHLRDGGSLIPSGSVHAVLGAPGYSACAASKAGVRATTRVLASEFSPRNTNIQAAEIVVDGGATGAPHGAPRLRPRK